MFIPIRDHANTLPGAVPVQPTKPTEICQLFFFFTRKLNKRGAG